MEHRAAAGQTAGQLSALAFQQAGAALLPRVLIAADDHGVLILPQVENAGFIVRRHLGQIALQRQITIGIRAAAAAGIQPPDHFRLLSSVERMAGTALPVR